MAYEVQKLSSVPVSNTISRDTYGVIINGQNIEKVKFSSINSTSAGGAEDLTQDFIEYKQLHPSTTPIDYIRTLIPIRIETVTDSSTTVSYLCRICTIYDSTNRKNYLAEIFGTFDPTSAQPDYSNVVGHIREFEIDDMYYNEYSFDSENFYKMCTYGDLDNAEGLLQGYRLRIGDDSSDVVITKDNIRFNEFLNGPVLSSDGTLLSLSSHLKVKPLSATDTDTNLVVTKGYVDSKVSWGNIPDRPTTFDDLFDSITSQQYIPMSYLNSDGIYNSIESNLTEFVRDIAVMSNSQPTSESTRIWVDSYAEEVIIPTIDQLVAEINDSNKNDNSLFPSVKAVVDYVAASIPDEIDGYKLKDNSVSGAALDLDCIETRHITDENVTKAKLSMGLQNDLDKIDSIDERLLDIEQAREPLKNLRLEYYNSRQSLMGSMFRNSISNYVAYLCLQGNVLLDGGICIRNIPVGSVDSNVMLEDIHRIYVDDDGNLKVDLEG